MSSPQESDRSSHRAGSTQVRGRVYESHQQRVGEERREMGIGSKPKLIPCPKEENNSIRAISGQPPTLSMMVILSSTHTGDSPDALRIL